jgi:hypothetical protein
LAEQWIENTDSSEIATGCQTLYQCSIGFLIFNQILDFLFGLTN